MKKMLTLLIALVLAMGLTCALAENEPTVYTSGDYKYILLEDGTAEITYYTGKAKELTIPAELDGYRVSSIGKYAFSWCSSLTSISIPDSVTSIGEGAFYSCRSLTSISIPDSVTSIGEGAFSACDSLTSISIPDSVTSIGDYAFSSCDSLTSISIPDSVTSIGEGAFFSCNSLTSISIPDSVTTIAANPFANCKNLTRIFVSPDHPALATIDNVLFEKSTKTLICYPCALTAKSYTIPQGIQIIGDYAFDSCYSLTSISIPNSVTSIGEGAFSRCYALTSISIPDSVTSIGDDAFSKCPNVTLTVGRNSYARQYAIDNNLPYTYPDALDWLLN